MTIRHFGNEFDLLAQDGSEALNYYKKFWKAIRTKKDTGSISDRLWLDNWISIFLDALCVLITMMRNQH